MKAKTKPLPRKKPPLLTWVGPELPTIAVEFDGSAQLGWLRITSGEGVVLIGIDDVGAARLREQLATMLFKAAVELYALEADAGEPDGAGI